MAFAVVVAVVMMVEVADVEDCSREVDRVALEQHRVEIGIVVALDIVVPTLAHRIAKAAAAAAVVVAAAVLTRWTKMPPK